MPRLSSTQTRQPTVVIQKPIPTQNTSELFAEKNSSRPVSEWQTQELLRRYILFQTERMNTLDWQEVHAALRIRLSADTAATQQR
jgi:hypothetical protein